MAQHDYNIANATAAVVRSDINSALSAIATNNSGSSAPSAPKATQWWFETDTDILKIRNKANTAWLNVAYLSGSQWSVLDNTKVVNTSGTQTGLLGDQAESTWLTGTSTTESLISPAKLKVAATEFGGVMTLLESVNTATSTSAHEFPSFVTSEYNTYIIDIGLAVPATNGVIFEMQYMTGSSALSTSHYVRTISYGDDGRAGEELTARNEIALSRETILNGANKGGWAGRVTLFNAAANLRRHPGIFHGLHPRSTSNADELQLVTGAFHYRQATSIDGIRFQMSSGNISNFVAQVYGVKNS